MCPAPPGSHCNPAEAPADGVETRLLRPRASPLPPPSVSRSLTPSPTHEPPSFPTPARASSSALAPSPPRPPHPDRRIPAEARLAILWMWMPVEGDVSTKWHPQERAIHRIASRAPVTPPPRRLPPTSGAPSLPGRLAEVRPETTQTVVRSRDGAPRAVPFSSVAWILVVLVLATLPDPPLLRDPAGPHPRPYSCRRSSALAAHPRPRPPLRLNLKGDTAFVPSFTPLPALVPRPRGLSLPVSLFRRCPPALRLPLPSILPPRPPPSLALLLNPSLPPFSSSSSSSSSSMRRVLLLLYRISNRMSCVCLVGLVSISRRTAVGALKEALQHLLSKDSWIH